MNFGVLLGSKLKKYRNRKHITQKQLANMIGGTQSSIHMYETGERVPGAEVLSKLIDALSLAPSEILDLISKYRFDNNFASGYYNLTDDEDTSNIISSEQMPTLEDLESSDNLYLQIRSKFGVLPYNPANPNYIFDEGILDIANSCLTADQRAFVLMTIFNFFKK